MNKPLLTCALVVPATAAAVAGISYEAVSHGARSIPETVALQATIEHDQAAYANVAGSSGCEHDVLASWVVAQAVNIQSDAKNTEDGLNRVCVNPAPGINHQDIANRGANIFARLSNEQYSLTSSREADPVLASTLWATLGALVAGTAFSVPFYRMLRSRQQMHETPETPKETPEQPTTPNQPATNTKPVRVPSQKLGYSKRLWYPYRKLSPYQRIG